MWRWCTKCCKSRTRLSRREPIVGTVCRHNPSFLQAVLPEVWIVPSIWTWNREVDGENHCIHVHSADILWKYSALGVCFQDCFSDFSDFGKRLKSTLIETIGQNVHIQTIIHRIFGKTIHCLLTLLFLHHSFLHKTTLTRIRNAVRVVSSFIIRN